MRSEEIRYLYDRTYFLGGISKHNGQKIGVTGYEEFRRGEIHSLYPIFADKATFKDKNVLDIGCGRGEILKYCLLHGAKSAVGVDFSSAAIEIAQRFVTDDRAKFYELPLNRISEIQESEFGVVYLMDVLEHVSNEEWTECFIGLKPKLVKDCTIIGKTPSRPRGQYFNMHNNYHTLESLQNLFGIFSYTRIYVKRRNFVVEAKA